MSRKIKREDNLIWLNTKLYQVYSENISEKCSLYEPEYNKKNIKKLFEENEAKNIIDILNKPVKEMFEAFIINNNQENIEQYLSKYRNIALNFESIFINKTARTNNNL